MTTYVPTGMLSFARALGLIAQARCPAAWHEAKSDERAFLSDDAPVDRFKLTLWASKGSVTSQAYIEARAMLSGGSLPAMLRGLTGAPVGIDPAAWHASGADRLAEILRGALSFGDIGRGEVVIRASDLDAALKGKVKPPREPIPAPALTPRAEPVRGKGGNRSNPEADQFWIEICRLVSQGDIKGGRAGLAERMSQWSSDNMDRPWDAETVRKKVGYLFKALGWS